MFNRAPRHNSPTAPRPAEPLVRDYGVLGDHSSQSVGLLPPPRIPASRAPKSADVAAIVGDDLAAPLVNLEAAVLAATNAVNELERNRPGPQGLDWRDALTADAADHAAGKEPAEYRCAKLLKTDPDRWAAAHMAARFVPIAAARCEAELDRPAIHKAAVEIAQAHADAFAQHAADGWNGRNTYSLAWACQERGIEALSAYEEAAAIADWATHESLQLITPEARGHWICLDLALNPGKRLYALPDGPVWPAGSERLIGAAALPDKASFELRQNGHSTTPREIA